MNTTNNTQTIHERIRAKVIQLYGEQIAKDVFPKLMDIVEKHASGKVSTSYILSEKDVVLITYGDQLKLSDTPPLKHLHAFLRKHVSPTINSVHILPFYPYSSDDGFSVIDYYAVDPDLGSWDDIHDLSNDFRLMFDAVFNHISARSTWFQAFLRDEPPYKDYFITVDPTTDLSAVVRPRTLPLLTPMNTTSGTKYVWTTFSDDQVDLDFSNPHVLLEMIRVLLFYVSQGAKLIRLDAIAFLWKKIGTSCIHLEETHLVIQLLRDVLDAADPSIILITETNVPHNENISYLGDGTNEAQMVYQFPLAPLILYTFMTGSAELLAAWAQGIERVGNHTTFFNFTASHDGIGLRPATGILKDSQLNELVNLTLNHGGLVSYRAMPDGSQSPYELNISYFDAITDPKITVVDPEIAVRRFIASQAIPLALIGVPGIYFHSLLGSQNYTKGVAKTRRNRTINREKLSVPQLQSEINDINSLRHHVFSRYMHLLRIRSTESAFHPLGNQHVYLPHPAVIAIKRWNNDDSDVIIALTNVGTESITLTLPHCDASTGHWVDLISGKTHVSGQIQIEPFQVIWLKQI